MLALGLLVLAITGVTIFSIIGWILEVIDGIVSKKIPIVLGIILIIEVISYVIYAIRQI